MNHFPPNDIPSFGVLMKVVESTVLHVGPKSPIYVELDLDVVTAIIHIIFMLSDTLRHLWKHLYLLCFSKQLFRFFLFFFDSVI